MSKAAKTAETIEFPTFDASKATDQFRSFAEKGVEQAAADNEAAATEQIQSVQDNVNTAAPSEESLLETIARKVWCIQNNVGTSSPDRASGTRYCRQNEYLLVPEV